MLPDVQFTPQAPSPKRASEKANDWSAVRQAHEMLLARAPMSRRTKEQLQRIRTALPMSSNAYSLLDEEDAPLRIVRWVAWGAKNHDRALRLALVLWLRTAAHPIVLGEMAAKKRDWSWPDDRTRAAAEKTFRTTTQYMGLVRHGLMPPVDHKDMSPVPWTVGWKDSWPVLVKSVASLDRTTFMSSLQRRLDAMPAPKRRVRVRLTEDEQEYARALEVMGAALAVIRRGTLRGDVSLATALEKLTRADATKSAAKPAAKPDATKPAAKPAAKPDAKKAI